MTTGCRNLLLVACFLLTLTGCQKKDNVQKGVTLETVSMFGGTDVAAPYYQQLLNDFQNENKDIVIQDESEVSTEVWKQKIINRFQEKETTPDVLYFFTGADARQLIYDNKFVSIDEIRQEYPNYANNIKDTSMEFMREWDGEYYCVPVKGFWEGLYCNKDIFDQYALPMPTNWDNFKTAVQVLKQNGRTPIAVSFNEVPHYWIEHMILSVGGLSEHGLNISAVEAPASWIAAMEELKKLYDMEAFNTSCFEILDANALQLFADKKTAMYLGGSWSLQSIENKDTTVVLPFPSFSADKINSDIISGFSSGFYISRKAWEDPKKRESAMRFVSYMTSNESITYLCEAGGAPSIDIVLQKEESVLNGSAIELQNNAQIAQMPIDARMFKDAWKYFCSSIPEMLQGEIAPEKLIKEVFELHV